MRKESMRKNSAEMLPQTKDDCCILFPVCNLLTRAEKPGPAAIAAGFALIFLRPCLHY